MKVKVTHNECLARQTVGVFKEVGKLIKKHGVREFVLFAGWRAVDTDQLVSCLLYVRVSWAVSKQGWWTGKDEVVATCGLRESLMMKAMPPPFAPDPPCRAGEGEDRVSRRNQVDDLGLVTGRAQPGLHQQHDVDVVVLNEGGYVGPPPGSADGSFIEEADKECVFGWGSFSPFKINIAPVAPDLEHILLPLW